MREPLNEYDVHATGPASRRSPLVDVHGHFGRSAATGYTAGATELLAAMDHHGIDTTLVMPQPSADQDTTDEVHAEIGEAVARHPGRLYGIVNLDPRLPDAEYRRRAGTLLDQPGFVAVKIHTAGFGVAPDDPVCDKAFRIAADHDVPVMVHTGLGGPHTLPHRVVEPARRYAGRPVVLCHAGFGAFCAEAIEVALVLSSVHLEPSWCPAFSVRQMVRRLGAHRVMFGSDHIDNIPVELAKFDAVGLTPGERRLVYAGTAATVFALEPSAPATPRPEVSA
ncbi:amidohydrolase family protein [Micromonospora sp. CNB394]|uniref:amidohydrolase family protein n=1 Tax=Micromonospora sp. CNB394 TaxID=1169151 RepID=UPI000380036F|nr:amidohydrolase family protein [Micromonospora sp. CNB394]